MKMTVNTPEQYYTSMVLAVRGLLSPAGENLDKGICPVQASARDWTLEVLAACVCTLCSVVKEVCVTHVILANSSLKSVKGTVVNCINIDP